MNIQNLGFPNRPLMEPVEPELAQAIEEMIVDDLQRHLSEEFERMSKIPPTYTLGPGRGSKSSELSG